MNLSTLPSLIAAHGTQDRLRRRRGGWASSRCRAFAATTVTFLGWQGYDDPVAFDDFLKSKGITLNTTYIGNNDEIVTKLRSGGIGQIDIVTPYMGYIPLLAKLDVIQPIDAARVPNLEKVMPLFRNDPNVNVDGKLYGVPFTWGSGPMMYDPAVIPDAAGIVDGSAEARIYRQGRHDGRSRSAT